MAQYVVTGTVEIYWQGRAKTTASYTQTVEADDETMARDAAVENAVDEADAPFGSADWVPDDWKSVGRSTVELLDDPEAQARYEARRAFKAMQAARVPTLFELAAAD